MTLVVARISRGRIAIASDTLLTEHGRPLPHQEGVIKSCMLPGDICVSFANSPELAARDFRQFAVSYPGGTGFAEVASFFERASRNSGNDYLVAFLRGPRLLKITDGQRISGVAGTQWIGDKSAYECFRQFHARQRKRYETGRAVDVVFMADELEGSPASDLYSVMRQVAADRLSANVGGFLCVVSGRDNGFRYSVYSDMLANWPDNEGDDFILRLEDAVDLGASGENSDYAVCQLSPAILGLNLVSFYLLKGKRLFLFYSDWWQGLPTKCVVVPDLEPADIHNRLVQVTGIPSWLIMVMSVWKGRSNTTHRSCGVTDSPKGMGMPLFCHANSFPSEPLKYDVVASLEAHADVVAPNQQAESQD